MGERGVYKYSRDTEALFKHHGFETVRWEKAPSQYDEERSALWGYLGVCGGHPISPASQATQSGGSA